MEPQYILVENIQNHDQGQFQQNLETNSAC